MRLSHKVFVTTALLMLALAGVGTWSLLAISRLVDVNRAIATQEVIEELIKLAKQLKEADQRGVDLGLSDDEVAFYDALAVNDSAVKVMGKDSLKVIATELVTQVHKSVTIDWTLRESARAKIKVLVKRILRKHGYPPDLQDEATKLVLQQAELLCAEWAA